MPVIIIATAQDIPKKIKYRVSRFGENKRNSSSRMASLENKSPKAPVTVAAIAVLKYFAAEP